MRQFGGYFTFASPDATLLVSLLPRMIHIRGVPRLAQLVRLVGEEAARDDIGRDLILERLVEILLIEALRAAPPQDPRPGLLRGLADPRVAIALRQMHGDVERPWTVPELARAAGMSRSAFFDRFVRTVGVRPMEYLLSWRMALAKNMLRGGDMALDEGGKADRLWLGQHIQHGFQQACRPAPWPLHAKRSMSSAQANYQPRKEPKWSSWNLRCTPSARAKASAPMSPVRSTSSTRAVLAYQLTPMGTILEGEWNEVMAVVTDCFEAMRADCPRVEVALKVDYREGQTSRLASKIASVEDALGRKLSTG